MPSHSGTDLTFNNALEKIKSFLINSSALWECVADTLPSAPEYSATAFQCGSTTLAGTTARTIYLKCTSYDGLSECYFALYNKNSASSYFNIEVRGIDQYVEGRDIDYSFGGIPYAGDIARLPLNGNTASIYHITGDERKVYLLVMAGTRPQTFGFGMFLQSGTPEEYPKPMFVGGSLSASTTHVNSATASNGNKAFFSPSDTLHIFTPYSTWSSFDNYGTDDTITNTVITTGFYTMPYLAGWANDNAMDARCWGNEQLAMFPIWIWACQVNSRPDVYGELDGVMYVGGDSETPIVAGDPVTANGKTYVIWRHPLLSDGNSYAAFEMIGA